MGATRMIATDLWQDQVWRRNIKEIQVRYLWLYLLTCTMSKTCGIYHLPLDLASMETRLNDEELVRCLNVLIDNKMCVYSAETEEIAITNFPKYNIRNLGKPMVDCVSRELALVKNRELIKVLIDNLYKYSKNINDSNKVILIHNLIDLYVSAYNNITYTNTNTNTKCGSVNDTSHDTIHDTEKISDEELEDILKAFDKDKGK